MPGDDLLPFLGGLQPADSAFPSGLYALSHGLEAYAEAVLLEGDGLEELIGDLLRFGVGPSDGVALGNAHRALLAEDAELAAEVDLRLSAVKLAREASVRSGRQLIGLASSLFDHPFLAEHASRVGRGELPGNHAVARGLAEAALGISRERALASELYTFCAGCAGASIRLSLIDHRGAQRLLHALKPTIIEVVGENLEKGPREIASCLPMADVMSMRHERAEARLFMS